MTAPERCIALFIDLENLVTHTGISSASFDLQQLLGPLEKKGRVVYRRAYADWSRFREAALSLHEQGVELVEVPPSSRAGKNSADIRLVVDALEACYQHPHLDTFAIASGDSDFCPLASKLRENNRTVIGLAVKQAASPFLVKVCDEFVVLRARSRAEKGEKAAAEVAKVEESNATPAAPAAPASRRPTATQTLLPLPPPRASNARGAPPPIPDAVREAVADLLAGATGKVNPSAVKSAILRRAPEFTERKAGFSTFAKLLLALEQAGVLRREQHGRQWYVLPPAAASPAEAAPVDAKAE